MQMLSLSGRVLIKEILILCSMFYLREFFDITAPVYV
jgi:hypothetical protein